VLFSDRAQAAARAAAIDSKDFALKNGLSKPFGTHAVINGFPAGAPGAAAPPPLAPNIAARFSNFKIQIVPTVGRHPEVLRIAQRDLLNMSESKDNGHDAMDTNQEVDESLYSRQVLSHKIKHLACSGSHCLAILHTALCTLLPTALRHGTRSSEANGFQRCAHFRP
jgi:hypothetical protein